MEKTLEQAFVDRRGSRSRRGAEVCAGVCAENRGNTKNKKRIGAFSLRGRKRREEIYCELTADGRRFCALAALFEEIAVLLVFGIHIGASPLPVLVFLWLLFAILTAAVLVGAASLLETAASVRYAVRRVRLRPEAVRAEYSAERRAA